MPRVRTAPEDRRLLHQDGTCIPATWADVIGASGDWYGVERFNKHQNGRHLDGVLHNGISLH